MAQPPASSPWPAEGGGPQPGPVAPAGYLYQVGDIGVTADTIVTYRGTAPLAGSTWLAIDQSRVEEKIPVWAIVMAVIFASLCLIGLLFLLVKEQQISGHVEVRVQSGEFWHVTHVPVIDAGHVPWIMHQVSLIQTQAHRALG
ncbi:MAG: hypothetical protein AAFN30_07050 [Actinomycetota bacterium]